MKLFLSIALVVLVVVGCQQPQIVTYNLSDNHPLLPECERGKALYLIYCSKCHNEGRRKDIIPDFDGRQLSAYTIRMSNMRHDTSLTEERIPEQELETILTFFMHKKKNPVVKSKR